MTKNISTINPELPDNLKEIQTVWSRCPGELFVYKTFCIEVTQAYDHAYDYSIGIIGGQGRKFVYTGPDRTKERYQRLLEKAKRARENGEIVTTLPPYFLDYQKNWKIPVKRYVSKSGSLHSWGLEKLSNVRFREIFDETRLLNGNFCAVPPEESRKSFFTIIAGNEAVYDWWPGSALCFASIANLLNYKIKNEAMLQRIEDGNIIINRQK